MERAVFRAEEVCDMAIEEEEQGLAFYGACLEQAADEIEVEPAAQPRQQKVRPPEHPHPHRDRAQR